MNTERLLCEEVEKELGELTNMELGTDTYKDTVGGITQMTDRIIKMRELEIEERKAITLDREIDTKLEMDVEERKDRKVKNRITVGSIVIPAAITVWGALCMFVFEEEGSITTRAGGKFIDRIFRVK